MAKLVLVTLQDAGAWIQVADVAVDFAGLQHVGCLCVEKRQDHHE